MSLSGYRDIANVRDTQLLLSPIKTGANLGSQWLSGVLNRTNVKSICRVVCFETLIRSPRYTNDCYSMITSGADGFLCREVRLSLLVSVTHPTFTTPDIA